MRAKDADWFFEVRINDRVHYIEVEEKLEDIEQEFLALQAENTLLKLQTQMKPLPADIAQAVNENWIDLLMKEENK